MSLRIIPMCLSFDSRQGQDPLGGEQHGGRDAMVQPRELGAARLLDQSNQRDGQQRRLEVPQITQFSASSINMLISTAGVSFRHLVGFKNILRSIECYGIASVHGINYYGRGLLSTDKYVDYIRYDVLGKDLLNQTINYVPSMVELYLEIQKMPGIESLKNW